MPREMEGRGTGYWGFAFMIAAAAVLVGSGMAILRYQPATTLQAEILRGQPGRCFEYDEAGLHHKLCAEQSSEHTGGVMVRDAVRLSEVDELVDVYYFDQHETLQRVRRRGLQGSAVIIVYEPTEGSEEITATPMSGQTRVTTLLRKDDSRWTKMVQQGSELLDRFRGSH